MKQEHTRNIQIRHRRPLLSSATYQITAIRVNYMCKNVSNELHCKTADFPQQKCVFPHMLFSGNAIENTYKFDSLCPYRSIRPLNHEDQIKFASGFTVTTFARYTLWPLTVGSQVENKSVLYRKESCFPCNILFKVIFI